MSNRKSVGQFVRATWIEVAILLVLGAFKLQVAQAQTPPLRTLRPAPNSSIPPRSDRLRPMVEVGAGFQHIIDQGPRILLRVQYEGVDLSGNPHAREVIMAASVELGIGSNAIGGEVLSRVRVNFTPYSHGGVAATGGLTQDGNSPYGNDWGIDIAPAQFTRESAFGVAEYLTVSAIGIHTDTSTRSRPQQVYASFRAALQVLGYAFIHTRSEAGVESDDHGIHLTSGYVGGSFGYAFNDEWAVELRVHGELSAGLAGGATFSGAIQSEIRVIYQDQPGFTRFSASIGAERQDFANTGRTLDRGAWSILARLNFGF